MLESSTIGIKNILKEYMILIVALEYLLELFKVYNCGQGKLEYFWAQITELNYTYMPLSQINQFWI